MILFPLFCSQLKVHNENGFVRFMATMLAYGFFGDIIHQSDRWRCLGPLRYDLAGFYQFIRHPSYRSEVTITLSSCNSVSMVTPFRTSCIATDQQQLIERSNSISSLDNSSTTMNKSTVTFCSRNCFKCAEKTNFNSNEYQSTSQIKREGSYTTVNCLNMSCRCAKSKYGMSPFVHLGRINVDKIILIL